MRIVSLPSWELFDAQPPAYRESVLPPGVDRRLAIETGASFGWERYTGAAGEILGIDRFGASAPGEELLALHGFTVENICCRARSLSGCGKGVPLRAPAAAIS